MPLPRQKFREVVFQCLFSLDFFEADDEDLIEVCTGQFTIAGSKFFTAEDEISHAVPATKRYLNEHQFQGIIYPFETV